MTSSIVVKAEWDAEAGVWVATSDDVPGLATEAETLESLREKLQVMTPELIDANRPQFNLAEIPLHIVTRQVGRAHNPQAA